MVSGSALSPIPDYSAVSSTLGGGAVGLAPFRLYREDCVPASPANGPSPSIQLSSTNHLPNPILLRMYGPVRKDTTVTNGPPIYIERRVDFSNGQQIWLDVTSAFTYTISGRTISINSAQPLPAGVYVAWPMLANNTNFGYSRLLCDQVAGNVPVTNFQYTFALVNGLFGGGPCIADVDDGTMTGTPDEGVTIDDLLYYLHAFELGLLSADVDDGTFTGTKDGGVTIDDLLYYLWRFEQGC